MITAAQLGLTDRQFRYAQGIITAVQKRGWEIKAGYIALATAIAESGLQMYANGNNPESLTLLHDNVGWDHGSVGLFQQQVGGAVNSTANWGTTRELMDPEISCSKFLNALNAIDWRHLNEWVAAQDVQHSAYDGYPRQANNYNNEYGGNYHHVLGRAQQLVNALWGAEVPTTVVTHPIGTGRTYTVQPGDNLVHICYHYPEVWITPAYVQSLNPFIKDINHIEVGWVLKIDNGGPAKPPVKPPVVKPKPPAPRPTGHPDVTVRAGESLTIIARRYPEPNITAQSIAAANVDRYPSLRNNIDHIEVGWHLRIR
jgi:hypothetical protein